MNNTLTDMKKILPLILALVVVTPLVAQHDVHSPEKKPRHDISEVVKDLSVIQKRKVDNISRDSKERVDVLRHQQQAVHDSIGMYMNLEGDHSKELYPLFEREAQLQVAVNREMYATKLRIDEVLKPEQRQALRNASRKDRSPRRSHR